MRIAVTVGDAAGIGPEVIAKALRLPLADGATPVVYGARALFPDNSGFEIMDVLGEDFTDIIPGQPDPRCARLQLAALEAAVAATQAGEVDAIVTAPWTKALFDTIGAPALGHTEHLARLFGVGEDHVMMLAGDRLRVSLVTTHLPLRDVADRLTVDGIVRTIRITADELRRSFGVANPRIAVCGLNPHAGERGHMGREEIDVIEPAIQVARQYAELHGPFPADTLFPRFRDAQPYDAVVAMYHDQGLIPLKYAHFGESANFTLGLPTPRTSVDHGSAWDIAGQEVADPASMRYALDAAVRIVTHRSRT